MDSGNSTGDSKNSYNRWDAISRHTTQVFPGGLTTIYLSLDNPGVWKIRAENLDRLFLGQETYTQIVNPEENGNTEMAAPDNVLYSGALSFLQKEQHHSSSTAITARRLRLFIAFVITTSAFILIIC